MCLKAIEFIGYGENKNSEYLNFIVDKKNTKDVIDAILSI